MAADRAAVIESFGIELDFTMHTQNSGDYQIHWDEELQQMNEIGEIGGYLSMEVLWGVMLHKGEIALNCGKNALVWLYLLRKNSSRPIRKLYIPRFLCSSISEVCARYEIPYSEYRINERLEPVIEKELKEGEWLYIVNYYGQHSNEKISRWKAQYGNIIIDNAQSYFQDPLDDVDTIYTCRKYFGVPDGAFLHLAAELSAELPADSLVPSERTQSYDHMRFLAGRFERTANEFYADFRENEERLRKEPVMGMSFVTENLLHGINYSAVELQRKVNWIYLDRIYQLGTINRLQPVRPDGPFMYPLWIEGGAKVRKYLQAKKIYVPTLWPYVLENCEPDSIEYRFAADLLPLPIDQRYSDEDMAVIAEAVRDGIRKTSM